MLVATAYSTRPHTVRVLVLNFGGQKEAIGSTSLAQHKNLLVESSSMLTLIPL